MSTPAPSNRRLAIAIGTAAVSATVAVGVTAGSLLGWFGPPGKSVGPDPAVETSATPANAPVILVPVAPTSNEQVQLVMDDSEPARSYARDKHHDHKHHKHGRKHDHHEDDDDD